MNNLLLHCDNLRGLEYLLQKRDMRGKIDLVYIDPPYATGGNFTVADGRASTVSAKKGIYEYLLTIDERHLNIRAFSDSMKRSAYERQKGICPKCKQHFSFAQMEGDHVTPWHEGGKTAKENCQMLFEGNGFVIVQPFEEFYGASS